jgi:hypothetical protein
MAKLVPYWRSAWRLWSVRLGVVGSVLVSLFTLAPDAMLQAWLMLPGDLKAVIPPQYTPMIGVAVFVLSMVARFIPQPKTAEVISEKLVESGKPALPNTVANVMAPPELKAKEPTL